ncbi:MAG: hypothetical protein OEY28_12320 [Nitrospira sp.]|nr:hypothetical protein [Nitrospira sp.]
MTPAFETYSPRARFDVLAGVYGLDSTAIDAIRRGINTVLPRVQELVRGVEQVLKSDSAQALVGSLDDAERARLLSVGASFVMRTIGCNFDDAFCDYAAGLAESQNLPERFVPAVVGIAGSFVITVLAGAVSDPAERERMTGAWSRLSSVLIGLTS